MGLFEDQPLLLVPFILAVVICYDLGKHVLFHLLAARSERPRRG